MKFILGEWFFTRDYASRRWKRNKKCMANYNISNYSRLNGCIENKYINSNENVDHTVTIVKDLGFCDFPKREQNQKTYEIIVCVIIGQNFVHYMVQWSNLD